MSFFRRLSAWSEFFNQPWKVDLAMDLGTANTLVYVKGRGIFLNEPSIIAIDTRDNSVIALGREAREYLGRTPPHIKADRPLKDGVIADFDAAEAMIKGFMRKIFKPRFWVNPSIVIGVPSGITQVEKRAVRESAYEAGARHIYLVEEPMAAAMGAGLDVETPKGNMVVDIGGGTTEVAIISMCNTHYCETIKTAGDEMDEAIVRYLQRTMQMEITQASAEDVKLRIGCATEECEQRTLRITGKEMGRGTPKSVELNSTHLSRALEEPVDAILDTIRSALENSPPALLADIEERGIILTGGGALLSGLDRLIFKMMGIRAYVAEDPLACVVLGCGMAMENPNRWSRIFIN